MNHQPWGQRMHFHESRTYRQGVQAPVEDLRGPAVATTHLGAKSHVSDLLSTARKVRITIKDEPFVASIITDQVHPAGLLSRNRLVPMVVHVFQCLDGSHLDGCIAIHRQGTS